MLRSAGLRGAEARERAPPVSVEKPSRLLGGARLVAPPDNDALCVLHQCVEPAFVIRPDDIAVLL